MQPVFQVDQRVVVVLAVVEVMARWQYQQSRCFEEMILLLLRCELMLLPIRW
jgi:hypothetical protein